MMDFGMNLKVASSIEEGECLFDSKPFCIEEVTQLDNLFSSIKDEIDPNKQYVDRKRCRIEKSLEKMELNFSVNGRELNLLEENDRSVSISEGRSSGNCRGHKLLIRKANNETLKELVYNYLVNVTSIDSNRAITYEETLINIIIPELLDRLD